MRQGSRDPQGWVVSNTLGLLGPHLQGVNTTWERGESRRHWSPGPTSPSVASSDRESSHDMTTVLIALFNGCRCWVWLFTSWSWFLFNSTPLVSVFGPRRHSINLNQTSSFSFTESSKNKSQFCGSKSLISFSAMAAAGTKEVIYEDDEKHPRGVGPTARASDGSGAEPSDVTVAKDPTINQTWRSYIWDSLDKPSRERRFLFKLDAIVLTVACLGSFIKYLDQINVLSAFVSGMKEDLGLFSNQLNYRMLNPSWLFPPPGCLGSHSAPETQHFSSGIAPSTS